jgi:NAD(P)-dependent dehydrogenase (short-subunit alcohol dehydrogenase family)
VKAERGGLDILFANAGTGAFAPLGEITPEHYDQIFDVNVKGTVFTVQKALPLMSEGGVDHPDRLQHGRDGHAGVQHLQRHQGRDPQPGAQLGAGPAGTGIRVNVLSPGPTTTELAPRSWARRGWMRWGRRRRSAAWATRRRPARSPRSWPRRTQQLHDRRRSLRRRRLGPGLSS